MLRGANITDPRNGRGYLGTEHLSRSMLISPSASSRPGPAYKAVSDAGSADINAASCCGHHAFTIACSVAKEWAAAGARFPQADNKKASAVIAGSEGSRRGDFTPASMQQTSVNSVWPALSDSRRYPRSRATVSQPLQLKIGCYPGPNWRQATARGTPLDTVHLGREQAGHPRRQAKTPRWQISCASAGALQSSCRRSSW